MDQASTARVRGAAAGIDNEPSLAPTAGNVEPSAAASTSSLTHTSASTSSLTRTSASTSRPDSTTALPPPPRSGQAATQAKKTPKLLGLVQAVVSPQRNLTSSAVSGVAVGALLMLLFLTSPFGLSLVAEVQLSPSDGSRGADGGSSSGSWWWWLGFDGGSASGNSVSSDIVGNPFLLGLTADRTGGLVVGDGVSADGLRVGAVGGGGGAQKETEVVDLVAWAMATAGGEAPVELGDLEDYPELSSSSPLLRALKRSNDGRVRSLQRLRHRMQTEGERVNLLVDRAVKDLESAKEEMDTHVDVIDPITAEALLRTDQPEEFMRAMPRQRVDLRQVAADMQAKGELPSAEDVVRRCMQLYADAEAMEDVHLIAVQIAQQEDREMGLRNVMLERLGHLDEMRDFWNTFRFKNVQEAKEKLMSMPEGEEKDKLADFLFWYLPFGDWWEKEGVEHTLAKKYVEEQILRVTAAQDDLEEKTKAFEVLQSRLWRECGLRLPHANWTEEQDEIEAQYERVVNASGVQAHCVDWAKVDPEFETRSALQAPKRLWKRDPEFYPDRKPNITFLLRFYGARERVKPLVDRLYACTKGMLAEGELPGVAAEMFVNVFEPDATLEEWIRMWHETDPGIFVVPVLPHIVADARAYNDIARMAKGDFLVFMQDDDLPPEGCDWLQEMLTAFGAWPRLGMVGYHTDDLTLHAPTAGPYVRHWRDPTRTADGPGEIGLKDPETGVRMMFTGLVNFAPVAMRRSVYLRLGGLDEADVREGEAAIISDWQLCMRVWLSGYQVARLSLPNGGKEIGDFLKNTRTGYTKVTYQPSFLEQAQPTVDYGDFDAFFVEYHDSVVKEVNRLNQLLVVSN